MFVESKPMILCGHTHTRDSQLFSCYLPVGHSGRHQGTYTGNIKLQVSPKVPPDRVSWHCAAHPDNPTLDCPECELLSHYIVARAELKHLEFEVLGKIKQGRMGYSNTE